MPIEQTNSYFGGKINTKPRELQPGYKKIIKNFIDSGDGMHYSKTTIECISSEKSEGLRITEESIMPFEDPSSRTTIKWDHEINYVVVPAILGILLGHEQKYTYKPASPTSHK